MKIIVAFLVGLISGSFMATWICAFAQQEERAPMNPQERPFDANVEFDGHSITLADDGSWNVKWSDSAVVA